MHFLFCQFNELVFSLNERATANCGFADAPCIIDEQKTFCTVENWKGGYANQTKLKVKTRYLHKKIARLTTFLLLFEHTKSTMYAVAHGQKCGAVRPPRIPTLALSVSKTHKEANATSTLEPSQPRARAAASSGVQSSAAVGVQNVIKYHHLRGQ
jgi:hypothetical protein